MPNDSTNTSGSDAVPGDGRDAAAAWWDSSAEVSSAGLPPSEAPSPDEHDGGVPDDQGDARPENRDGVRVPGISGLSDRDDDPTHDYSPPVARSEMHRGHSDSKFLSKTHRMLIGTVVQGMERREMTQDEVCRLTGLSKPYISQLLSGKRVGTMVVWDQLLDAVRYDYQGLGRYEVKKKA